jgi:hypothetical protein
MIDRKFWRVRVPRMKNEGPVDVLRIIRHGPDGAVFKGGMEDLP